MCLVFDEQGLLQTRPFLERGSHVLNGSRGDFAHIVRQDKDSQTGAFRFGQVGDGGGHAHGQFARGNTAGQFGVDFGQSQVVTHIVGVLT